MRFPVNDPYIITTTFSQSHPGIDIAPVPAGKTGVLCYAPESGIVVARGYSSTLEGNYCIIRGNSGIFYYFGHFAYAVPIGLNGSVIEGQQIGVLGMTGLATGIHTHHEVRRTINGSQIDPLEYYKTKEEPMSTVGEVEFNNLYIANFGPMEVNPPTDGDRKRWIGTETNTVIRSMNADPRRSAWLQYIESLKQSSGSFKPYSGKDLFEKVA